MARYSRSASKEVKSALHRKKNGSLKSGTGGTVKSKKQAIAIALKEAGASKYESKAENKMNLKKTKAKERAGKTAAGTKSSVKKSTAKRTTSKHTGARKSAVRKSSAKK